MSWIVGWYSSLTRASLPAVFSSVGIKGDLSSHESRCALPFIHLNLEKSNVFVQIPPNRVPHVALYHDIKHLHSAHMGRMAQAKPIIQCCEPGITNRATGCMW